MDSVFNHNNALAHSTKTCIDYLNIKTLELIKHPPYSLIQMKERRFSSDEFLLRTWVNECAIIPKEIWLKNWFCVMERCFACVGNYFEKNL